MHGVGRRWFVSSRQHACAAPCSSQVDDKVLEAGKLESDATASDAREMQVAATVSDVTALSALLSGRNCSTRCLLGETAAGKDFCLNGRTILPPHASSRHSKAWLSKHIWPTQAVATVQRAHAGLFYLSSSKKKYSKSKRKALHSFLAGDERKVCTVRGRGLRLRGGTLQLGCRTALVLTGSCSGVQLSELTISGGLVVCHGAACSVKFTDVTFDACTLVVTAGAHVTLERCSFLHMQSSVVGLGLYATGKRTLVVWRGGCVAGGAQGVVVSGGARLEASDITIAGTSVCGMEVKGQHSYLVATSSKIHEFTPVKNADMRVVRGVHVHGESSAKLQNVVVSGMYKGVVVRNKSKAYLADCTISDTAMACVLFRSGTEGSIVSSKMSGSRNSGVFVKGDCCRVRVDSCDFLDNEESGMLVEDSGSHVDAAKCRFLNNGGCGGAVARHGCKLSMHACQSSGNKGSGYVAEDQGTCVQLKDCTSSGNNMHGMLACCGGKLVADTVTVEDCLMHGVWVASKGTARLTQCIVRDCKNNGLKAIEEWSWIDAEGCTVTRTQLSAVHVCGKAGARLKRCVFEQSVRYSGIKVGDKGTVVEIYECTLQKNRMHGAVATHGGMLVVKGCRSGENTRAGFWAQQEATMIVTNSSSDGDSWGPSQSFHTVGASSGGKLTFEEVTVDGATTSGMRG